MPGTMIINDGQGWLPVNQHTQTRIIPGLYQAILLVAPQIVALLTIELIQMQPKAAELQGFPQSVAPDHSLSKCSTYLVAHRFLIAFYQMSYSR